MSRNQNANAIFRSCVNLLKEDPKLLWLPVISIAMQLAVVVTFVVGGVVGGVFRHDVGFGATRYVALFAFYLAVTFVGVFCNAAIIVAVNERIHGGSPTMSSAFAGAWERRGRLFAWALFSATISTLIRMLEDRMGIAGRAVSLLIFLPFAVAWSLVSFLVFPVLIVEDIGVRDAIKRSTHLFKETWGERIMAGFRFGVIYLGGFLACAAVAIVGIALGGPVAFAFIGVAAIGFVALSIFMQTITTVFQTVLYTYASTKTVPTGFDEQVLNSAYVAK